MSKLIFLVDDDKMIINLMEYTFHSRPQYQVKSFFSGEDCVDAMEEHPDLIVLDHQLSSGGDGKMDGIETLEKVRKISPDVPVIVLTAHGSDELYRRFIKAGAKRFLTKDNFFVDALIDSIGEVLH
ncbi:MAG: response regulator [Bacteroidales bacterium]|nr:response regulator [Bacteroidales bacterium]MDT8430359.1 response regulator [Bacteroidales bacterium]